MYSILLLFDNILILEIMNSGENMFKDRENYIVA